MKYFKKYIDIAQAEEVTKEDARHALDGWWKKDFLDDIFDNNREFRLYTAFADVYTMDEKGAVPMAGFYGTVGK